MIVIFEEINKERTVEHMSLEFSEFFIVSVDFNHFVQCTCEHGIVCYRDAIINLRKIMICYNHTLLFRFCVSVVVYCSENDVNKLRVVYPIRDVCGRLYKKHESRVRIGSFLELSKLPQQLEFGFLLDHISS